MTSHAMLHECPGVSIREYLIQLGWSDRYLDRTCTTARLGVTKKYNEHEGDWLPNRTSCFEPFGRFHRLFVKKRIPVNKVLSEGTRIRFLCSLRHDLSGSGSSIFDVIVQKVLQRFTEEDLSAIRMFEYLVEPRGEFEQFPFDRWLTVGKVDDFYASYKDDCGRWWMIRHVALTYITQVEIMVKGGGVD